MKVWGRTGRSALYVGYVYMPTNSTSVAVDACYVSLTEDVHTEKERWCCLAILMLELVDLYDVIGMFSEDTCNASGNRLVSFRVRQKW